MQDYFLFLMPAPDVVEKIQNKTLFYQAAETYGLPVPRSFSISSEEELSSVISSLDFPCIIKPVNKQEWWHKDFSNTVGPYRKAFRCENKEELLGIYSKISHINQTAIVQESIEGNDSQHYSVNLYVDDFGIVKGYYIVRKMRMYPISAGRGCFFITVHDDKILEKAIEVKNKFSLKGLINIQFKRDIRTNHLKLIEAESRLSVSNFLGPASGMNLAVLYYNDFTGQEMSNVSRYKAGVRYADFLRDIKAFFQYRKEGLLNFGDWFSSYRRGLVFNGYMLSDPRPALMDIWFVLKHHL